MYRGGVALRASAAPGVADGSPPPAAPSVTASSVHAGPYDAERAVDGNPGTRWASRGAEEPRWLHIDFGAPATVSGLTIAWEAVYAVEYEIQGSEDGLTWRSMARKTDGQGGRESFSGSAGATRHLRILCLKPAPFNLYSIWEIEFAGEAATQRRWPLNALAPFLPFAVQRRRLQRLFRHPFHGGT